MPKSKEEITHEYPRVGRCIYCASTENLTDEHIIPASLRGGMLLPDSSCEKCARIVNSYEKIVGRNIFGHFRVKLGFKARNAKERNKYLETPITIGTISPQGRTGTAKIKPLDKPIMLFTCKFDKATFLRGLPETVNDFRWTIVSWSNNKELDALKQSHNWDGGVEITPYPVELARTVAKIAYASTVAEFGLDAFTPLPMLLKTIKCETENVSYCVGGDWELPNLDPAGKHILGNWVIHDPQKPLKLLIVGNVWLFPAFGLPKYHVVLGHFDLENPKHASTFHTKMKDAVCVQ